MTSGLRKVHRIIWILLTIIIPVLIIFSVKSIKESLPLDQNIVIVSENSNQHIILEDDHFSISIIEKDAYKTVRIVLKKSLKSASSLVYGISENAEDLLGPIDKTGVYNFTIDNSINNIKIHDDIKQKELINIKL